MKRLRVKRTQIMITSVFLIALVVGFAIATMLSNTASFSVSVVDTGPLEVTATKEPDDSLSQDLWYNDTIEIEVKNLDPNQGYDFYFWVQVNVSGEDLACDGDEGYNCNVNMTIEYDGSPGDEALVYWEIGEYGSGGPKDRQRGNFTDDGGVKSPAFAGDDGIHITEKDGADDDLVFTIRFIIYSGAPTGSYSFMFWTTLEVP